MKKKLIIFTFIFASLLFIGTSDSANSWYRSFSIGDSTLDTSSVFDVNSTTEGSRPYPSMTESQRDAISSPTTGLTVYNTDTNKVNVYNDTSWTAVGASTGQGGINYVKNADFEESINDVAVSGDFVLSSEEIVNIRGLKSLQADIPDTVVTNDYIELDMNAVDAFDTSGARKLNISFDYATNAAYVSDDLKVYLRDVTGTADLEVYNDTNGLIRATGGSSTRARFQASVNVNSNSAYTLRIIAQNNIAASTDIFIDNVKVGPEEFAPGYIWTEWKQYTPTFQGFGTPTSLNCWYRRVGSNYELSIGFTSGTNTGVEAQVSLPNGKAVDANIAPTPKNIGGIGDSYATHHDYTVLITSDDTYINMGRNDAASDGLTPLNGNIFGNNAIITFTVSVPIEGLKASNLISTQESLFSTVKANLFQQVATGTLSAAFNTVVFPTKNGSDIFNIYNASTGEITIPKDGFYRMSATLEITGTAGTSVIAAVDLYNQTSSVVYARGVNKTEFSGGGSVSATKHPSTTQSFFANKGDIILVRSWTSQTTPSFTAGFTGSFFSIEELPDFSVFGVHGETELIESDSAGSVAYTITASTWGDLTSIPLTPGEWDIQAQASFYSNGAVTTTDVWIGIYNVSGASSPITIGDDSMVLTKQQASQKRDSLSLQRRGIIVTSTETYYLKAYAGVSITNLNVAYKISARRIK